MMRETDIKSARAPTLTRRNVLIGAGLAGVSALAHGMIPHRHFDLLGKGKLEQLIPNQLGAWKFVSKSGLVVPPQDQLANAVYSQLLTRVYTSENRLPIMLLVAQSGAEDGVLQIHRPEFCYPAGGFTLSNSRVHLIDMPDGHHIPTRVFTASGVSRTEQLLYWTRIGRDLPTSWAEQRLSVAEANLRGEIPDAVMVRISAVSSDPDAIAQVDEFARLMIGSLTPKSRPILIGSHLA